MINSYKQLKLKEFELDPKDYMKYIEEFYNSLKYNISYSLVNNSKLNIVSKPSEFIIALYTKPRKSFVLNLKELTGWEGYLFFNISDSYLAPDKECKKILAVLMIIPSLVVKAKRMKSVAEQLYMSIGNSALIENEELIFKMDKLEGLIDKAVDELKSIGINIVYDIDKNTIIVPYGNMVMREFSTKEIMLISSTLLSMFKYLYAIEKSGTDFVKNMNLLGEFEKWKTSRKNELKEISDRIGE